MIEHDEHEYERSGVIYILPPFPERRYFLHIYLSATVERKLRFQLID